MTTIHLVPTDLSTGDNLEIVAAAVGMPGRRWRKRDTDMWRWTLGPGYFNRWAITEFVRGSGQSL